MFQEGLHAMRLAAAASIIMSVVTGCATGPGAGPATTSASAPSAPAAPVAVAPAAQGGSRQNDYTDGANWLCRPGRADACGIDLTSTALPFEGAPKREGWETNMLAPVDCFYVYPTISNDPTPNSDMTAGPEEKRAAQEQFARFGAECRLYAPVYRQITLAGLRKSMTAGAAASGIDAQLAYGDVADAWRHYLQHDNKGRGVILVGHSQGARMLSELVKREIEGKPVQKQLVAAYLIGFNIGVAKGKDTGGAFDQIPLCRKTSQTGCVVAYSTFRETAPPPANSRFGRMTGGQVAACTNPAALAGGRADLHAYLPVKANLLGQPLASNGWAAATEKVDTPFVNAPAFTSAECVERDGASYLSVRSTPTYQTKGIDIPGDLVVGGRMLDDWGLHLVDMDLAMGNLARLARQQAQAYADRAK